MEKLGTLVFTLLGGGIVVKQFVNYQFNKYDQENIANELLAHFSLEKIEKAHRFQQTHALYKETPLVPLANLARHLQVGSIFVKNEAERFGLQAFKVLGGIYAIGSYLANELNRDIATLSFEELQTEAVKQQLGKQTFVTATDGNHGKGVAWAARELGHQAIIYLPKGVARTRVEAIQSEGAKAVVTEYNYDDSVRLAAKEAEENGWVVLQDTSWPGYERIPLWIMQGYASLAKEIVSQLEKASDVVPTHLFLQVGVGSYAASIAAYFVNYYKKDCPKIILVEPDEANCYYESFRANEPDFKTVGGDLDTIMAGLSCGEPNPQAWKILKRYADISFSVDDRITALGMRVLGHPLGADRRIIAGESGSVSAGLLYSLTAVENYQSIKNELDINENSQIILINTEGDTDQANYRRIVWEGDYSLKGV